MIDRFQSFVTGITTCYKCIQRIKAAEMTELGLKGTHLLCIFFLHHNPEGLTAATLSQLCAEDKAAISRTISTLKDRGFVEAHGQRYRAALKLTSSGTKIAAEVDKMIDKWVPIGGDGLTDEERDTFYKVLEHIAGNLAKFA